MNSHPFKSLDAAFLNSAYLSELWAVRDLVRMKRKYPNGWTQGKEKQLIDEARHARILLNLLHKMESPVIYDLKFSMQERLYKPYIDLTLTTTLSESSVVHNMTESRALWIYKTYLKIRPHSDFKDSIESIVKDENSHFECNDLLIKQEDAFLKKTIFAIDKLIFRDLLPQQYGRIVYENHQFWNYYYKDWHLNNMPDSLKLSQYGSPYPIHII